MRDADAEEQDALNSNVIDSQMMLEEMGNVFSSEFSSGPARAIGHQFFKTIGITAWDRQMRIAATTAAIKSIVSSFKNEVPAHSARWLSDLNLKHGDIFLNGEGRLITSPRELVEYRGVGFKEARKLLEPTHAAINRWVSRAIVAPNAAMRPTRMSDPHYAMFAQFKSFTYAFQATTMNYAMHEAENGNLDSGAQLLRGVPIMLAADLAKAMVSGGGSLPGYMANWTLADWVGHAINRSGDGGTLQFATDIMKGDIANTLGGPTVGQFFDAGHKVMSGNGGSALQSAIPVVKQFGGLAAGLARDVAD
jgi:hypothetical protein